jgi:hypothetical protein
VERARLESEVERLEGERRYLEELAKREIRALEERVLRQGEMEREHNELAEKLETGCKYASGVDGVDVLWERLCGGEAGVGEAVRPGGVRE